MNARDSLLIALPAALLGAGIGYVLATLGAATPVAPGGGSVSASGPTGRGAVTASGPTNAVLTTSAPRSSSARTTAVSRDDGPETARVSESELARAMDGLAAPSLSLESGDGTIAGSIVDDLGNPMAGVVVVASKQSRSSRGRDPLGLGAPPPTEQSLDDYVSDAAGDWASRRAGERRATTRDDGVFVLDGLPSGSRWDLRAYADGWSFEATGRSNDVAPGQSSAFRGSRVYEVRVDLRLPTGESAHEGLVHVEQGDARNTYAWTAAEPTLRLLGGRASLRGYAGVEESWSSRGGIDSDFASDEESIRVEQSVGTPVVLSLATRGGIRGVVEDPWEGRSGGGRRAVLLALPLGADFDEDELAGSDRQAEIRSDEFEFLDLVPGTYAVGISTWQEDLFVHEIVEVGQEPVRVTLRLPEADPSEYVRVRVYDPSGRLASGVDFTLEWESDSGSSSNGVLTRRTLEGEYWFKPEVGGEVEFFEPWPPGSTFTLTARHDQWGEREVEFVAGTLDYEIAFEEPVSIIAVVDGYVGSGFEGELRVDVQRVETDEESNDPFGRFGGFRSFDRGRRGGGNLSSDGEARFDGLAPGAWRVVLQTSGNRWQGKELATQEVDVVAGERYVQLAIPPLYEVSVLAPELSEGEWLYLREKGGDGEMQQFWWGGGNTATLDEDHRAVFDKVLAGDYVLSANNTSTELEVSVPCGEVYFEARSPDCMRVSISDIDGALYEAGFRGGDLVIGANGADFEDPSEMWGLLNGSGGNDFTVLRDGQTLTLHLESLEGGNNWWESLGGSIQPDVRP